MITNDKPKSAPDVIDLFVGLIGSTSYNLVVNNQNANPFEKEKGKGF